MCDYSISRMSHQDCEQVILINKQAQKQKAPKETVKRNTHVPQKDVDIETHQVQMVTSELMNSCKTARLDAKHTQDSLAKLIQVPPKNIQMLESKKLTLKEAKQIALKIERHLRVKILAR